MLGLLELVVALGCLAFIISLLDKPGKTIQVIREIIKEVKNR